MTKLGWMPAAAVLLCLSGLRAEEAVAPPPPPPDMKPEAPAAGDAKAMEKDKAEKDKAEKEKAKRRATEKKLAEFERDLADQPGGGPNRTPAPMNRGVEGLAPYFAQINLVDRALLSAALEQYRGEKRDEAVATATRVVDKSTDADGVGMARVFLGRVALEKNQPDEAKKLFRSVTGRAAGLAAAHLLEPLGKPDAAADEIAKEMKDLVAAQKTALDRCRVVKALLDYLARPVPPGQGVPPEVRTSLMLQAADWIPYEDAVTAQAELAKDAPMVDNGGGPRGGFMARQEAPPPAPEMPREILDKLRDLRNMEPDQRKEVLKDLRGKLMQQVEKLKGEGREEDANRLKEMLDRFDRGNNKGDKGAKKPEPLDPEKAKAEIKRLEDQGFAEEANKLKRQLEMQEKPMGDANDNF